MATLRKLMQRLPVAGDTLTNENVLPAWHEYESSWHRACCAFCVT